MANDGAMSESNATACHIESKGENNYGHETATFWCPLPFGRGTGRYSAGGGGRSCQPAPTRGNGRLPPRSAGKSSRSVQCRIFDVCGCVAAAEGLSRQSFSIRALRHVDVRPV